MHNPSNAELERLFAQHDISIRRLYPWWYRVYRLIGVDLKPPIFFSLAEHFIYEGSLVAVICIGGILYNACCMTSPLWVLTPAFAMILVAPLLNWWNFRRLRRRIGL